MGPLECTTGLRNRASKCGGKNLFLAKKAKTGLTRRELQHRHRPPTDDVLPTDRESSASSAPV
ncbi:hypothetical protein BVI434_1210017 [Burkholderia vietnamiensis]|nr:hypothetical protein BVI434_1210017 [Burkholderia vietnamiensis]